MKFDLETDSINKLLLNFSLPAIGGMLIGALYIIVDGIFIGKGIGASGIAAINIAYPVITLGVALSMMFGIGGSTVISILQGQGKGNKAGNYLTHIILLVFISYLGIVGATFKYFEEIIYFLGSNDSLFYMVKDYLLTAVPFLLFFMLSIALNAVVRNDNSPNYAMFSMVIGTVINITLDWLFILEFGMGMKGAALATGVAQLISFLFLLGHFFRKKCQIKAKLVFIEPNSIKRILENGFSSFVMELATAIVILSFNKALMVHLGEIGAAAFGVISYVFYVFTMIFTGLAQGIQPIVSYNFGAKKRLRVREILTQGKKISLILSFIILISVCFKGDAMIGLFNNEEELLLIATRGLLIYTSGIVFLGFNFVNISFFQSIEQPKVANILSVIRSLVYTLLGLAILPKFLGVDGIWLSLPFSDLMTFCTTSAIEKKNKSIKKIITA